VGWFPAPPPPLRHPKSPPPPILAIPALRFYLQ